LDYANSFSLVNQIPNLDLFNQPLVNLLNYSTNLLTGTFASDGLNLYKITGSFNTYAADFVFASPNLTNLFLDGSGCNASDIVSFHVPKVRQICPTFNSTIVTPTVNSSLMSWSFQPFDNWFYQRMTIYGNVIYLAVCKDLCLAMDSQNLNILVPQGFIQYGKISPTSTYDCDAVNCFLPNCCLNNQVGVSNPCAPVTGGEVNCITQVVTYNETLQNFTAVNPTQSYYCDVDTGACFQPLNPSYLWNSLSIILLCIAIVIFIVLLILIFVIGCRMSSNFSSM
jgi:hypothetical protein